MFLDRKRKGEDMKPEIVGNRIKELMKIEGIKEEELANNLRITSTELEKKLNGKEEFCISQMMEIKELFHLNLDIFAKLFFEEDFNFEEMITNLYK